MSWSVDFLDGGSTDAMKLPLQYHFQVEEEGTQFLLSRPTDRTKLALKKSTIQGFN